MDDKYYEKFGKQIDAYVMSDLFDHTALGKTIEQYYLLLRMEEERDLRDKYNGKDNK